jgi:hypothetical protein
MQNEIGCHQVDAARDLRGIYGRSTTACETPNLRATEGRVVRTV